MRLGSGRSRSTCTAERLDCADSDTDLQVEDCRHWTAHQPSHGSNGRYVLSVGFDTDMKKTFAAVAAIGAVLLAAGCSSGDAEDFKARSGTQQYDSAQAIADDLAAAGITCENFTKDKSTRYSTDAGRCTIDGHEIVLSIFTSDELQEENIANLVGTFEPVEIEYGLLIGSKWMINCGDTKATNICTDVKAQLGGRIVKPTYI